MRHSPSPPLRNPDNVVIVPQTGDTFLQEDGDAAQYVRGVTPGGEIYDFARAAMRGNVKGRRVHAVIRLRVTVKASLFQELF